MSLKLVKDDIASPGMNKFLLLDDNDELIGYIEIPVFNGKIEATEVILALSLTIEGGQKMIMPFHLI